MKNSWSIKPQSAVKVSFEVTNNGQKAIYTRTYIPRAKLSAQKTVLSWSDYNMDKSLKLHFVKLYELQGSPIKGFRFIGGTDYSNIKIPVKDSLKYNWLKIKITNPANVEQSLTMKYHSKKNAIDGLVLFAEANSTTTLIFPFVAPDKDSPIHTIELWKSIKNAPPMDIIVESITLHQDKPIL